MQAEYVREVNRCYMLLQSSEPFDETSYEMNMISANRIPSLLPMSVSHIDRATLCQYDISSLQPFSVFCSAHKLHEKELSKLLENLLDSLFLMEDYLLSPDHLLLEPEHLYLNWTTLEFGFAYVPFYSCDLKTSLLNLMEYLLGCLENNDRDTIVLAYRICHELKEPNLQLANLRKLLIRDTHIISSYQNESFSESVPNPSSDASISASSHSEKKRHNQESFSSTGSDLYSDPTNDPVPDDSFRLSSGKSGLQKLLPEKETWKNVLLGVPAAVLIYAMLHIYALGYFSLVKTAGVIGCILALLILMLFLLHRRYRSSSAMDSEDEFPLPVSQSDVPDDEAESAVFSTFGNKTDASSYLSAPFPEDERTVLLCSPSSQTTDSCSDLKLIPEEKEHHTGLTVIELNAENLLLGFQSGICDKVIPDPTVSRIHARIVWHDKLFYLTDLSSRNGTFVDDRQLNVHEEIPLQAGMHIRFGGAAYIVQS